MFGTLAYVPDVTEGDVERLRSGDPEAFGRIYRSLSPAVIGYLTARGSHDPEGLAQEVFLTVFRRCRDLHGGVTGLRTFVFSVAHARLVDEWRAAARQPESVEHDATTDPRHSPSAEDSVASRASHASTMALLARLPEAQRVALSLRVVAGLSLEESAQVMGRSVGSIKQLQRRGLLALRALLEEVS